MPFPIPTFVENTRVRTRILVGNNFSAPAPYPMGTLVPILALIANTLTMKRQ